MCHQDKINNGRERVSTSAGIRSFRALTTLIQGALIAALYLVLTVATSFMSFQTIQLRLAEALTALPALFPSGILGVFAGCLLSNLLNPSPLGLVDVIAGSATTLFAAYLTWITARPLRHELARRLRNEGASGSLQGHTQSLYHCLRDEGASEAPKENMDNCNREHGRKSVFVLKVTALLPSVILNALVVGFYLPFLLSENTPSIWLIFGTMGSILLSQALVVYGLGLPLITALQSTPWAKRIYLTER